MDEKVKRGKKLKITYLLLEGTNMPSVKMEHVCIGTVNRDLSYLSQQAQDNLRTHIQQRLPEQYQKCKTGLNQALKVGWDIVQCDSSSPANRLAALSLINHLTNILWV